MELTLSESALLAGLTQAPSIYNPFTAPGRAEARRATVLRAMFETGVITKRRYTRAVKSDLALRPGRLYAQIREPYFFGYVRDRLIEVYGAGTVRSGGLRVYTTIKPRYQRLAEKAIRDTMTEPDDPAAALISISPRTGAIRAMAAIAPNQPKNQFNLVSQARRQPGSTFKTFVLAAAVEQGINPDSTYYVSAPFTYKVHPAGNCDDGSWWCVHTYANDYYGWSSIRSATIRSDNSVYAQLTLDVTPRRSRKPREGWASARRSTSRARMCRRSGSGRSRSLRSTSRRHTRRSLPVAFMRSRWPSGGSFSRAARKTRTRVGESQAAPRDLGGNRCGRDEDPRAEHAVGNRHPRRIRPPRGWEDRDERRAQGRLVRRIHAGSRDDGLDRIHAG